MGGGTDGGTTFMAEQLNHTNSEVVYFDFSKTSMEIAQHRAKFRGGLKIVWVIDWIESIPRLGLGSFDLAVSTGVLHHLKSPQRGLKIVNDAQTPDGGAEFMVYGTYGRTTIYWLQLALRMMNEQQQELDNDLKNAKHLLDILPPHHLFQTNNFADHRTMGDIGIYDLLLHKRDVSFTTISVYQWLQNAGYNVVDHSHLENTIPISLNSMIEEKELLRKLLKSKHPKIDEMGEIIYGGVIKQDLYVSKKSHSEANVDDLENTMIYAFGSPMGFRAAVNEKRNYKELRNETFVFTTLARSQKNEELENWRNWRVKNSIVDGKLVWPSTKFNSFVLENITKKPIRPMSLSSLINKFKVDTNSSMTLEYGKRLFKEFYFYLKDTRIFMLKHKSVPIFPLTCCSYNLYTIMEGNIPTRSS